MFVGTLEVELRLEGCRSLKEKRSVIRPILDRSRRRFSVSSAEVGDCDLWNSSILGFAIVSNDPRVAESLLAKVQEEVESIGDASIVDARFEVLRTN